MILAKDVFSGNRRHMVLNRRHMLLNRRHMLLNRRHMLLAWLGYNKLLPLSLSQEEGRGREKRE